MVPAVTAVSVVPQAVSAAIAAAGVRAAKGGLSWCRRAAERSRSLAARPLSRLTLAVVPVALLPVVEPAEILTIWAELVVTAARVAAQEKRAR